MALIVLIVLMRKQRGSVKAARLRSSVVWWRSVDVVGLNHSKFDREFDVKFGNKFDICNP